MYSSMYLQKRLDAGILYVSDLILVISMLMSVSPLAPLKQRDVITKLSKVSQGTYSTSYML